MAAFPRSAANKTDRRALKALAMGLNAVHLARYNYGSIASAVVRPEGDGDHKDITTVQERLLQNLWVEIFGLDTADISEYAPRDPVSAPN